ncbi:MAG: DM13 domain-containing protein [Gaiellaceae bacterium]
MTARSLLLAPVSAAVVLVGIWLAGGVLTDSFRASMALTTLWFGLVAAGAIAIWLRAPALRLPVSAVAVATMVLVGGYLALGTLRDKTVDEALAAGTAELMGSFESRAHTTSGSARVTERADGSRVLALVDFRTDAGPDLFVYLAPSASDGDSVGGATRLGALKGNVGNQQYELPATLDLADAATVIVWCRAFTVSFGTATLRRT